MSFTNKTPNYDLPQYIATDKPSYLVDANGAYLAIDTAMKANETAAATAQSTADTNTAAIGTLNGQINNPGGIAARVSDVETLSSTTAGNVNTINALIGNGEPTTTDKTLIGAINELAGKSNIQYVGTHDVSVSADGTKSYDDLMGELFTAITAYVSSKGSTYASRVVDAVIGTSHLRLIGNGFILPKATAYTSVEAVLLEISGAAQKLHKVSISGTPYYRSYDLSTSTFTSHDNEVPAADTAITVTFEEYNIGI